MSDDKFKIARNIRVQLDIKGWKPGDLKRELKQSGHAVGSSALSNYLSVKDSNNRVPPEKVILAMAKVFGCKVSAIYGEDFEKHDQRVEDMHRVGKLGLSKSLGFGDNLESIEVRDDSTTGISIGDIVLVDKSVKDPSIGLYAVLINNRTMIASISMSGDDYHLVINGKENTVKRSQIQLIGAVVAKFTRKVI